MRHLDIITKKYDQWLLGLIIILCGLGTVMLYSASSSFSLHETSGASDTLFLRSHLKRMIVFNDWLYNITIINKSYLSNQRN